MASKMRKRKSERSSSDEKPTIQSLGKILQEIIEYTGNPPQFIEDEDVWEKAKAATKNGKGAEEPYSLIMHVYRKMGGKIKKGKGSK